MGNMSDKQPADYAVSLADYFRKSNPDLSEQDLEALIASIHLEHELRESDAGSRKIKIEENELGELSARSSKFPNLLELSFKDIFQMAAGSALIGLGVPTDPWIKVLLSVLLLLKDFHGKMEIPFTEKEARILALITTIEKPIFNAKDIVSLYDNKYQEQLNLEGVDDVLGRFDDLLVIKWVDGGWYETRERMVYRSKNGVVLER